MENLLKRWTSIVAIVSLFGLLICSPFIAIATADTTPKRFVKTFSGYTEDCTQEINAFLVQNPNVRIVSLTPVLNGTTGIKQIIVALEKED